MKNKITISVPSDLLYWPMIEAFYEKLVEEINFGKKETKDLKNAFYELFENSVVHAYKEEEGYITIDFIIFHNALQIDVHDKGMPIDPNIIKAVPIDLKKRNKGLNRVYQLVDEFAFHNLGLDGKKFTIIKYTPYTLQLHHAQGFYSDILDDFTEELKKSLSQKLVVRTFKEGDEVWIPKLIYKNYGYTYFKDIFYFPDKILQKEKSGDVLSIVAEVDKQIVGHFALVRLPRSNIAEIGIAVVDPAFKGMGIMKKMFELLLLKAKELRLDALFGEAITFHPYSQRANARYGFKTSALLLGEIHHMVRLKDHPYPFRDKRGAVVIEYKLFKKRPKKLFIPRFYEDIVQKTYNLFDLAFTREKPKPGEKTTIELHYEKSFALGIVIVDEADGAFAANFKQIFEEALTKHPDMIYADINLEKVASIDNVIDVLHTFGFFYAGVLFLRKEGNDYLRMQFEASERIEEKRIVCYSDFCKELHRYILEDKKRVYKNI